MWRTINEAFGKSAGKASKIIEIKGETDSKVIADTMNQYFCTIADKLAQEFPDEPPAQTEPMKHQPKFNFVHTDDTHVTKLINQLSDSTAVGIDGISPRVLKAAIKPLSILIAKLINKSLDTGIFPDQLKIARVSPIYKAGGMTDPGNYRPISVLSAVSKIYERIVHAQLTNYIDQYSLLSNSQFGFRKNHSTETCLSMLDKMYKELDKGYIGGVVFLDLKKAFDTVNHKIMVRKLVSLGVSINSARWFESYLMNRCQLTKIDDVCSECIVSHGMPQGSILGPLLFLIFINDLNTAVELCGTSMYADDTTVFYFARDEEELALSIQYDMQSISYWMRQNRLNLNVSKTKFMKVGSRQRLNGTRNIGVSLNGELIETVVNFKYLGLIMDQHLQFHPHIDYIIDKTMTKLGLLYKTRTLFDVSTALMLFKSLITPHFDYGCLIYEVAPQYQLQRLQIVQNAAARLILLEQPDTPIYELHERLHFDTLATRRSKTMVKVTFAVLHDQQPLYLLDQLKATVYEGRQTRATESGVLMIPRTASKYGQLAYSFRGPVQWNLTDVNFKTALNKAQLKTLLKTSWYRVGNS